MMSKSLFIVKIIDNDNKNHSSAGHPFIFWKSYFTSIHYSEKGVCLHYFVNFYLKEI